MYGNSLTNDTNSPPPPHGRSLRIGELLRQQGLITNEQLETAIARQANTTPRKLLGQILVEMKVVKPEQVVEVMAKSVGVPFAWLTPEKAQRDALPCLPREFLKEHNLLPLTVSEGWLTIAVEHFSDICLIDDINRRSGLHVRVVAAEADNIRRTRAALLETREERSQEGTEEANLELDKILGHLRVEELKVIEYERKEDEADLNAVAATDSPIIKLVNCIIQNAVETGASDIHIEPDDASFRVRYRVDGDLIETVRPSNRLLPAVVSRIKILAGMDISERRLPQDGGITVTLTDRSIDLRVSSMATKFGEKVVMRIVDRGAAIRSLDSLGLGTGMLQKFRATVRESNGIVIVTGPTGSGKTSTLYGVLSEIVSVKHNISTIEDPVERRLPGTNQFQVNAAAGFTFASALRSLLRQDPDVVMVGEIRDPDTAKLATEAALTGHLVLTTLHTNDAATAVPRLVNMGVEPYLVAASLRGVLAQRLVRRVCPDCRRLSPLSPAKRETLAQICRGSCPIENEYVGTGCPRCHNTGYAGRIGVFELLLFNEEMLTAIARDPSMHSLRNLAVRQNLHTLLQDGLDKIKSGLISVDGLLEIVSRTDLLMDGMADSVGTTHTSSPQQAA